MLSEKLSKYKIVLGSGSPRRKELLSMLGLEFEVRKSDANEDAPTHLSGCETAIYVALQKAEDLRSTLLKNELLITSDTEVWLDERRFGKPSSLEEAKTMLRLLSGKKHQVISAVCVVKGSETISKAITTQVFFKEISEAEIDYYVENYKPLDKAGAYGIQEWIGLVAIQKIEGSYFNVVGLPIFELNEILTQLDNE